ncbi:MAG TPA: hypothetical protein VFP61_00115 [Acidimicrobiales bacterium]|nr:hypothetical protein [Acidimicrobiales bacterium]
MSAAAVDGGGAVALDSLRRRMRALFSLYEEAVATMGPEHVNAQPVEGALPIAFSLFHYVHLQDASMIPVSGTPPVWDEGWAARVQPAIADHGKERTPEEMQDQRIDGWAGFGDYQAAVFARTEGYLAGIGADDLDRVVVPRPLPDRLASTFSARVAGSQGITVLDALECWIYQHGMRHMGEIEYVRGLLGLGGLTS